MLLYFFVPENQHIYFVWPNEDILFSVQISQSCKVNHHLYK